MWLVALLQACVEGEAPTVVDPPQEDEPRVVEVLPPDPGAPTRSGPMVPAADPGRLLIADSDHDAILLVSPWESMFSETPLQGEPTRMVRHGDRLWVTLRGAGAVAELALGADGAPRLVRTVQVGAEPYDLAFSADGATLWVSLSMQEEVVGLDPADLSVVVRHRVEGEPRWLTAFVDPIDGADVLAVVPFRGARVELITPDHRETLRFPPARRSAEAGCEDLLLVPRASGELLWDEEASSLWVPGVYADTEMPATPAGELGPPVRCPGSELPPSASYYGSGPGVGRFNAVIVHFDRLSRADGQAWLVATEVWPSGLSLRRTAPVSLYLGAEGFDRTLWIGLEGEQEVVLFPRDGSRDTRVVDFLLRPSSAWSAPGGATAVRPISWVEHGSTPLTWAPLTRELRFPGAGGGLALAVGESRLPREAFYGRRHFSLVGSAEVSDPSLAVTCSSCHVEGRTDGLTWRFPDMDRQTPSLAGPVAQTAPFTWTADVPTVAEEARLTSELRMGGTGLGGSTTTALTGYIEWTRDVILPQPSAEERELWALGRELFSDPAVGCATCHAGPRGTVDHAVPLHGFAAIGVPALAGIVATPPYFHDGSAPTLRAVLERSRDGSMGDTSGLGEREMEALEVYLRFFGG